MGRFTDYHIRTALTVNCYNARNWKGCEQATAESHSEYGDTVVNWPATASKRPRQDIDFFPLAATMKKYAVGKI